MSSDKTRSCLLITYGPVPTPQYQTVEGGGMRVWGLAKGLLANGLDVTVAANNAFPQEISEHEGVRLVNWGLDEAFAELINSFDSVIISYCMGDPSVFVVDNINDNVQLVLDAYVPIYVEVSARESEDIDSEYSNYMTDIARFNKVLRRGDYFLCANETQKTFYTGVLSSLGIINPRSYREKRVLVAPFGIHSQPALSKIDPYKALGIKPTDFTVLWFGGIYPWFHVQELLSAILVLSKNKAMRFVFVGGKNPFNPNPDFFKQYELAVNFAKKHGLINKSVFFVDWVDFDDRINWYKHADLVISLNKPGEENRFSWRTRVMDYVWGELAILTNGGDPLSDDLVAANAAVALPDLSGKVITESINELMAKPAKLKGLQKNITGLKPTYYWENLTRPIAKLINHGHLPYKGEDEFKKGLGLNETAAASVSSNKYKWVLTGLPDISRKVRKKGVLRSAKIAVNIAKTQLRKTAMPTGRRYVFISHPINHTGAPLVLMQMIEEYAARFGARNVHVIAPGVEPEQLKALHRQGVNVDKAVFGLGFRFIRAQLGLRRNDFVLMNTAAIYDNYRDFIMLWLRNGRLNHAYWFIHEDQAQLPVIHKEFLEPRNLDQTHKLLESGKLTMLAPSKRTKDEYDRLLKIMQSDKIKTVNLHVEVDDKYIKQRPASDYAKVDFLISGTPSDGRKAQLLALAAFYEFIKAYYESNPKAYRDFKLHLVAIGDDYISQQVEWVSDSLMKNHVVIHPSMPKVSALELTARCNAVICCSLNETFGLYIAEGMMMGHVVLRNNSAGVDEQLKDGVNGYFIDHTDVKKFAAVIEKVLNKKTNSNTDLQTMGHESKKMAEQFRTKRYLDQIESLN